MKIQCDVCEKAEASVLCCADEAALCWACDEKVHAANKLAEKHQRVPLLSRHNSSSSSSSQHPIPRCDICQEKAGYFFCLEDRALLCRQCDVSTHSSSSSTSTTPYVSSHQRFLLTGVKLDTNNYNNSQHGRQQNNSTITNAAAASSPNPTIDVNNKRCWDTFSSAAETPTTTTTDHLGVQQPHWPSDYQFHNNNTNTTTDCFDHYYEFPPSQFGSSRSISSSQ